MNDANPRWHQAEGGPDDERDPYLRPRYYQQQPTGYDQWGRPVYGQEATPYPQQGGPPPQQTYADPYQQGWIPQQQPYYDGPAAPPGTPGTGPQPTSWDTGQQTRYDTGGQGGYGAGQQAGYETGRQAAYGTGRQPPVYDTGQQAVYDTGQQQVYGGAGGRPGYDPGGQAVSDTGQQAVYDDTGRQAVYDPGGRDISGTGQQPVYDDTGQYRVPRQEAGVGADDDPYHTTQFSFVDEESEHSDEVIDWLKFSESRTERREESKRRSHHRRVGLVVVLVLALIGGAGYLWGTGRLPGLGTSGTPAVATGGAQKRDMIVVHLLPVGGGPSATALLVDNTTKGRGTTVLIPDSVQLVGEDGNATTLDKSVADGVGPTRDALNTLLGTDVKGSWRLDSPYLELLVDSLGDVLVDTNATIKGTGKDSAKTLVRPGQQQELNGQAAVAYAMYKGPGETQDDELKRFGQVMQAVLKKMPSDAADATRIVQGLAQILDPSLNDRQLGASLAGLAELAKTGAYDTTMLPVTKDGMLSSQATDGVVKDVLGGAVNQKSGSSSAQPRVQIQDATGTTRSASMAQAAIVNGGTYTYVPGGKASSTHATSKVTYADPARLAAAKDVAATLGLPASAVVKGTVPSNADIVVRLGRDYKPPTDK